MPNALRPRSPVAPASAPAQPLIRRRSPPPPFTKPPLDPKAVSLPPTPKPILSPALDAPRTLSPPPSSPPDKDVPEDIDMETFQQILDLDDEDREFSRGMAWAYFSQAEQTFKEMQTALSAKDLAKLSSLGHFLKGSSAALGVNKVQASCEKIQHYGVLRDEEANKDLSEKDALARIDSLLSQVQKEYALAEQWLKTWYDEHPDPEP